MKFSFENAWIKWNVRRKTPRYRVVEEQKGHSKTLYYIQEKKFFGWKWLIDGYWSTSRKSFNTLIEANDHCYKLTTDAIKDLVTKKNYHPYDDLFDRLKRL